AKPVTVEQYRRSAAGHGVGEIEEWVCTTDSPVIYTSWFQAAVYCNWLSEQEKIPSDQWCYVTNPAGRYEAGIKMGPTYLQRTGYRLPTEGEVEYATRAGAMTSRYFGETEELLPRYAGYAKNSQERAWPVGSLKPNDLGLFD